MEETSLDDFLDAGTNSTESDQKGASGGGPTDGETVDGATSDSETERRTDASDDGACAAGHTDGIESAATTFAFSPEGVICVRCGDRVLERWRSEEGLVCSECKEWTAADR